MVSARPSSCNVKSSFVRLLTIWLCLSRTVASTFTTFTSTAIVGAWPWTGCRPTNSTVSTLRIRAGKRRGADGIRRADLRMRTFDVLLDQIAIGEQELPDARRRTPVDPLVEGIWMGSRNKQGAAYSASFFFLGALPG